MTFLCFGPKKCVISGYYAFTYSSLWRSFHCRNLSNFMSSSDVFCPLFLLCTFIAIEGVCACELLPSLQCDFSGYVGGLEFILLLILKYFNLFFKLWCQKYGCIHDMSVKGIFYSKIVTYKHMFSPSISSKSFWLTYTTVRVKSNVMWM